ncbi:hypothetical protein KPL39_09025 [Clostridium gasigenes]|uniref:nuclease domain-containing protein n=1 Tax=Clostridium gasigenes TaxID=94869 RepID=UPI001C0BB532|nr:hypothetical protein [Clostridium gasigenes]
MSFRNKNDDRIYIFDAKYRVEVKNDVVAPLEDDINVMHRYRDAIVYKLSNKIQFKYDTFGAYVMFPYGDEEKFKDHNLYKSIEEGGVRYYGKIKSCKEYNREECVEIKSRPGTEKKKYLRIELEEIKETTKIELIQ